MKLPPFAAGALCALSAAAGAAYAQAPVIPGAGGTVCEFIAANAGQEITPAGAENLLKTGNLTRKLEGYLVKAAVADIDGDGDTEVLDILSSRGEAHTIFGAKGGVFGEMPPYGGTRETREDDERYETLRWSDGARWLNYGGKWHAVFFDDINLLVATGVVTLENQGPRYACMFSSRFEEDAEAFSGNRAADEWFMAQAAAGPGTAIGEGSDEPPAGDPLSENDILYITTSDAMERRFRVVNGVIGGGGPASIDMQRSLFQVDVDGDGMKERLVSIWRGGTSGCDAIYQDLLPPDGQTAPDRKTLDLVRRLQGAPGEDGDVDSPTACGMNYRFVDIGGQGYLYTTRLSFTPVRTLQAVRNGRAVAVAQSTFAPVHTVTFDASKERN